MGHETPKAFNGKTIGKPQENGGLLSGKHTKDYGQSQSLMGKSTISMAIFNSKLLVYPGIVILRVILRRWKTWDIFKKNEPTK